MAASVEAIVIERLTALTGVRSTATRPQDLDPPLHHVEEIPGGREMQPGFDSCIVVVSSYAVETDDLSPREAAFDAAHAARDVMNRQLAGHVGDGATVSKVIERQKPVERDSGDSITARYEATYEVQIHHRS